MTIVNNIGRWPVDASSIAALTGSTDGVLPDPRIAIRELVLLYCISGREQAGLRRAPWA